MWQPISTIPKNGKAILVYCFSQRTYGLVYYVNGQILNYNTAQPFILNATHWHELPPFEKENPVPEQIKAPVTPLKAARLFLIAKKGDSEQDVQDLAELITEFASSGYRSGIEYAERQYVEYHPKREGTNNTYLDHLRTKRALPVI
jgi:hypothetical protein